MLIVLYNLYKSRVRTLVGSAMMKMVNRFCTVAYMVLVVSYERCNVAGRF